MARQVRCGPAEARARCTVARRYLDVAELARAEDDASAWHNVAAGNAVLAGIAAADALCCLLLGRHSREADHRAAATLLATARPASARDLERLLQFKDTAHYGSRLITAAALRSALRAAERLVTAAEETLTT